MSVVSDHVKDIKMVHGAGGDDICMEPHLGLATTEQLLRELSARYEISKLSATDHRTAEILGEFEISLRVMLHSPETEKYLKYRTFDG